MPSFLAKINTYFKSGRQKNDLITGYEKLLQIFMQKGIINGSNIEKSETKAYTYMLRAYKITVLAENKVFGTFCTSKMIFSFAAFIGTKNHIRRRFNKCFTQKAFNLPM